jgi:hypothetical protein
VRTKIEAHRGLNARPLTAQETAENPYRMIRLLKACCQGGQDEVTMLFTSASLVGIEECCRSLLAHCCLSGLGIGAASNSTNQLQDGEEGEEKGEHDSWAQPGILPEFDDADPLTLTYIDGGDDILRILAPAARVMGVKTDHIEGALDDDGAASEAGGAENEPYKKKSFSFRSKTPMAPGISNSTHKPKEPRASKANMASPGKRPSASSLAAVGATAGGAGGSKQGEAVVLVGSTALTASENFEDGCLREGGAFELLSLLVEMVDSLPLSESQVRSPLLWLTVKTICVPAIDSLARHRDLPTHEHGHHTSADRVVCAELVDLLDRLLFKISNHNLIDDVLSEQYRSGQPIVDDMRDDLNYMAVTKAETLGKEFSGRTREAVDRIFKFCDGHAVAVSRYKH